MNNNKWRKTASASKIDSISSNLAKRCTDMLENEVLCNWIYRHNLIADKEQFASFMEARLLETNKHFEQACKDMLTKIFEPSYTNGSYWAHVEDGAGGKGFAVIELSRKMQAGEVSDDELKAAISSRDSSLIDVVLMSPKLSDDILKHAWQAFLNGEKNLMYLILSSPSMNRRILAWMAAHDDYRLRKIVTHERNITIKMMNKLAKDKDSRVRAALATSHRITKSIWIKLSVDESATVRNAAMKHMSSRFWNDPIESLRAMARMS